jgi:5'-deoxynucleotidase YfbR-like HD superfamily hydrolase
LLHDAPEYVIGDLISPFKAALGLDYKAFEVRLLAAIHVRFGLPESLPTDLVAIIKNADRVAAFWEATRLAGFSIEEANRYFGRPLSTCGRLVEVPEAAIEAWPTAVAQKRFVVRFALLDGAKP